LTKESRLERFTRLLVMTEEPKNPVEGDVYYNPVLDGLFVFVGRSPDAEWDHGWTQLGVDASPNGYLEEITEMHRRTRGALDALVEAIELSHDRGEDGECRAGCPGCEVASRADQVMVARRFLE
jgi:hypothetical protein